MAKTIQQNVTFKAKAAKLYSLYADSKLHSAATGQKATVGAAGGKFSAFGGMISGKILQTVKNKPIVQTWRAKSWKKADPGSILILTFEDTKSVGRVSMVHANVASPNHELHDDSMRFFEARYPLAVAEDILEAWPKEPGAEAGR